MPGRGPLQPAPAQAAAVGRADRGLDGSQAGEPGVLDRPPCHQGQAGEGAGADEAIPSESQARRRASAAPCPRRAWPEYRARRGARTTKVAFRPFRHPERTNYPRERALDGRYSQRTIAISLGLRRSRSGASSPGPLSRAGQTHDRRRDRPGPGGPRGDPDRRGRSAARRRCAGRFRICSRMAPCHSRVPFWWQGRPIWRSTY